MNTNGMMFDDLTRIQAAAREELRVMGWWKRRPYRRAAKARYSRYWAFMSAEAKDDCVLLEYIEALPEPQTVTPVTFARNGKTGVCSS